MEEHRFGKILQNERKKRGISQAKLAEMTGLTIRAISYWENGKRKMTLENADKVFKALNTKIIVGQDSDESDHEISGE